MPSCGHDDELPLPCFAGEPAVLLAEKKAWKQVCTALTSPSTTTTTTTNNNNNNNNNASGSQALRAQEAELLARLGSEHAAKATAAAAAAATAGAGDDAAAGGGCDVTSDGTVDGSRDLHVARAFAFIGQWHRARAALKKASKAIGERSRELEGAASAAADALGGPAAGAASWHAGTGGQRGGRRVANNAAREHSNAVYRAHRHRVTARGDVLCTRVCVYGVCVYLESLCNGRRAILPSSFVSMRGHCAVPCVRFRCSSWTPPILGPLSSATTQSLQARQVKMQTARRAAVVAAALLPGSPPRAAATAAAPRTAPRQTSGRSSAARFFFPSAGPRGTTRRRRLRRRRLCL